MRSHFLGWLAALFACVSVLSTEASAFDPILNAFCTGGVTGSATCASRIAGTCGIIPDPCGTGIPPATSCDCRLDAYTNKCYCHATI